MPSLTAALDRSNVSDSKATMIVAALASGLGKDLNTVTLSRSTMRITRSKNRASSAANIKAAMKKNCDGPLIAHWDGKMLPAITGAYDGKTERLPILVSGNGFENLLGVPKLESATGQAIASSVYETLEEWELSSQVVGISFDTTASNTGKHNGACVGLQRSLGKPLLWLPCRHHTHKVIVSDAFKSTFGNSSGPEVRLFKRFADQWPSLNHEEFEFCNDRQLDYQLKGSRNKTVSFLKSCLLDNDRLQLPHDDYREVIELAMLFDSRLPW